MVGALHVVPGQKIADLGCGRGGPGQWIAGVTGAALVGIDFSAVALEQARARARRLGIASSYQSGSFDATGLDSASVRRPFRLGGAVISAHAERHAARVRRATI